MTDAETGTCASCGSVVPFRELDSKPTSARYKNACHIDPLAALLDAAERNEDFTRLECRKCYGPGYIVSDYVE